MLLSAQSQDDYDSEGMPDTSATIRCRQARDKSQCSWGQRDATEGKAIADYDPDIDYKPEGSEPDIKAVNE